jgi:hypothetical protein
MRIDPLETPGRRRAVVVAAGALVIGAFIGSVSSDEPTVLPGIALGSSFLLHVERALAVEPDHVVPIRGSLEAGGCQALPVPRRTPGWSFTPMQRLAFVSVAGWLDVSLRRGGR